MRYDDFKIVQFKIETAEQLAKMQELEGRSQVRFLEDLERILRDFLKILSKSLKNLKKVSRES